LRRPVQPLELALLPGRERLVDLVLEARRPGRRLVLHVAQLLVPVEFAVERLLLRGDQGVLAGEVVDRGRGLVEALADLPHVLGVRGPEVGGVGAGADPAVDHRWHHAAEARIGPRLDAQGHYFAPQASG
jgi:hypothetical protein